VLLSSGVPDVACAVSHHLLCFTAAVTPTPLTCGSLPAEHPPPNHPTLAAG
jgi:hypothetical protein